MTAGLPHACPISFEAVERPKLAPIRTYRLYINQRMIAGAYVAAQARDEESFWQELGGGHWLFNLWLRRRLPKSV